MARSAGRIGMGIVVGGLLAMGATVVQRELLRRAGTRLIDWEGVRQIARRRRGPRGGAVFVWGARAAVRPRGGGAGGPGAAQRRGAAPRGFLPPRPAAQGAD